MSKFINLIKERLKKIDWILIFFLVGFTGSLIVSFKVNYQITKNIFFVIGIIASYILVAKASDKAKEEEKLE